MRRLLALTAYLLVQSWSVQASEPEPMSPAPSTISSMMLRSEAEAILDEFVATCNRLLSEQERAFEARLEETAELAAAEAARPLLIQLAGAEAEVRVWQRRALAASVISAVVAGLLGVLLGALLDPG